MRHPIPISILLATFLALARDASGQEWPAWAKDLPEKAVEAKVGDKVWATVPAGVGEMVTVMVCTVSAAEGSSATLADQLGRKYDKVPGALIHPLLDRSEVKGGEVVHGYQWGFGSIVCRVTKLGRQAEMKHWWFQKVTDGKLDDFEPLRTGVEPMAWISYPSREETSQGFCIALDGDRAWILEGAGQVVEVAKGDLGALPIGAKDFQAGDKVLGYKYGFGYQPGTVESVVEPGLAYVVKLDDDDDSEAWYFADLVPAP